MSVVLSSLSVKIGEAINEWFIPELVRLILGYAQQLRISWYDDPRMYSDEEDRYIRWVGEWTVGCTDCRGTYVWLRPGADSCMVFDSIYGANLDPIFTQDPWVKEWESARRGSDDPMVSWKSHPMGANLEFRGTNPSTVADRIIVGEPFGYRGWTAHTRAPGDIYGLLYQKDIYIAKEDRPLFDTLDNHSVYPTTPRDSVMLINHSAILPICDELQEVQATGLLHSATFHWI